MKLKCCFTFAALLAAISLFSQTSNPPPCPIPPPPGAEDCLSTCIYCDFDGFHGINNGTPSGGNIVCGQISVHNDMWFAFIAGTSSITINVVQSNCQNGDGLQLAVFESCDALDALVCNPGCGGCGTGEMILQYDGYIPGRVYYFMIDGWVADVCEFDIVVEDGVVWPCGEVVNICEGECVTLCDSVICDSGYYELSCEDSLGNAYVRKVLVQEDSPYGALIESNGNGSITCENPLEMMYSVVGGAAFTWLDGNGMVLGHSQNVTVFQPGLYTLQVKHGACVTEDKFLVKDQRQIPQVSATGGVLDANHPTVKLMGHSIYSGVTYLWTGPNGFSSNLKNPVVNAPGTYTLTVTMPSTGCSNTAEAVVTQQ